MKKSELNRDLYLALNRGDVEAAKKLIARGADVNATSRVTAYSTLLWLTVKAAGQEISKNFRELGAGLAELLPNVPQRNHAAAREKNLRILRLLLEAKADVNKPSHGGTPLRIAVCGQDLEVVELLLANGANPNAETFSILSNLARKTQPSYRNTVLHEAIEKGSVPITEALLAAGADASRTDHEGKTPLAIAQEKGFRDLAALLQNGTTVQSPESK